MSWYAADASYQDPIDVNRGYVVSGNLQMELPAVAALGDQVMVVGKGGFWEVLPATGDIIYFGPLVTISGQGGSLKADTGYDVVQFLCVEANSKWRGILYSGSPALIIGGTVGYFTGGASSANTTRTDKITFSTDTTAAATTANLAAAKQAARGLGTSVGYGLVTGGFDGNLRSEAHKITYSNSTIAAQTTANLNATRYNHAKVSYPAVKGYYYGGFDGYGASDQVQVTNFATIVCSTLATSLTPARQSASGVPAKDRGYFMGGNTSSGEDFVTNTTKITFSNDGEAAVTTANLSEGRSCDDGISDFLVKGFSIGGYNGGNSTKAEKIVFSTETISNVTTANLSTVRRSAGFLSEGSSKGYCCGGYSTTHCTIADKIMYATETTTLQTTARLSVARYGPASQSNCGG
jgi:hypothetical protein